MSITTVSVRLDDEQLHSVDETVELLSRKAQGVAISRATGLRAIILKGVQAIRSELGAESDKTK